MLGWKTILAGVLTILYGVLVVGLYSQDWNSAIELVLAGLAILGIGHKLDKLRR